MSKGEGSKQIDEKEIPVAEQHSPVEPNSTLDGILVDPTSRQAAERKLVRLLDMRLLPTIIVTNVLNCIDRVAVSSARLQGLEQDLNLTDIQFNTVIAILLASYAPFQIPSNMILNRIPRPSYYIPFCVCAWGLTSACTGLTKSYASIMVCRVFIGLPEATFYPGCMYLLSRWYTRKELAFRGAIDFSGLLISNAFGSLIPAGILGGMQGKREIAAWRWLFYIEGCATICVGIASIFLLPDYPYNTRWLTLAQRRLAQIRLAEDAGEADEDGTNGSCVQLDLMTYGQG